jgi:hypothetical protein
MNRNRLGCIFAGVVCLAFWPSVAFGQIEASPKVDPCKDPNVRTDVRPNVGGPNCWHCISIGSAGRQLIHGARPVFWSGHEGTMAPVRCAEASVCVRARSQLSRIDMLWDTQIESMVNGRVHQVKILDHGEPVSYAEAIDRWQDDGVGL